MEGHHPPVEQYLEMVHVLNEEGVPVIQARLVERLGYSPQAVSEMVHRLVADGYLAHSERGVVLTERGASTAERVVRRHRLAERFLVDIVGLPWVEAHAEADRWEHVISDTVEARFAEILGHPRTCPHGNPIPGEPRDPAPQRAMADFGPGDRFRLARITERVEDNTQALVYLADHGLFPGRGARVRSRAPDGTLTLELEGEEGARTVAIGPDMGRQLFVTSA
ncbi:MAG TPA: metal-dependent transcriptional regulator [Acidimicrobiales bacterium]|nr:metal-dependent transcriptional regulator [Acidimicrobiales bacterium]